MQLHLCPHVVPRLVFVDNLDVVILAKTRRLQPAVQQQVAVVEESPDDYESALPAPLQRQGSLCSLPISCGSENEPGPDSTSSPVSTSVEPNDKLLETEQPPLLSSRDHRTVLAGDARSRYHCRNCGRVFCSRYDALF